MSSSPKVPGPSRTMSVMIFIAISLALLAAGYGYYRSEAGKIRSHKYEAIAAIGDLKTGQIQAWRKERLADAARFASGPVLRRFTEALLRNPASKEDRAILLEQLRLDRMGAQYHEVLVAAPDGRVALSTGMNEGDRPVASLPLLPPMGRSPVLPLASSRRREPSPRAPHVVSGQSPAPTS